MTEHDVKVIHQVEETLWRLSHEHDGQEPGVFCGCAICVAWQAAWQLRRTVEHPGPWPLDGWLRRPESYWEATDAQRR
jgi:hypothetical protein